MNSKDFYLFSIYLLKIIELLDIKSILEVVKKIFNKKCVQKNIYFYFLYKLIE